MSRALRILLIAAALAWSGHIGMEAAAEPAAAPSAAHQPLFIPLEQVKWDKILPELGEGSPEIAILRIEPATRATQLLIRTPRPSTCASTGTRRMRPTP